MWLVAAVDDLQPYLTVIQAGVAGVVILMAATGHIWFKPAVDEQLKRIDRAEKRIELLEAKVDHQAEFYAEAVLPALVANTEMMRRLTDTVWRTTGGGRD